MTDNEIIKALECCQSENGNDCENCPYSVVVYRQGEGGCTNKLMQDALDLINRQKAELELKTMDINSLASERDALQEMVEEQKAEIERLSKTVVDLNANLSESIHCFTRMETLYKIKCNELKVAKSEARKEFWERLMKQAVLISDGDNGFRFEIREDDANKLLKVMEVEEYEK